MSDASDFLLLGLGILILTFCGPQLLEQHDRVKRWFQDSREDDFTD